MLPFDIEYRNAPDLTPKNGLLTGYAAVFNKDTTIGDFFIERIAPAAFRNSIAKNDVVALIDHDSGRVIGRKSAGTLRIGEDRKGLWVEIDPPNSPDGQTARELVGRTDLRGMSFGFRVVKEAWDDTGDLPVRRLDEVELFEVSAVAFPQYKDTSIVVSERAARRVNDLAAKRRDAARKARMEQKFRGIR